MKRIFVALDGSPRAALVLGAAARLAESVGAKLVLFRAVGLPLDVPNEVFAMPGAELEEILRAGALADLERQASSIAQASLERIFVRIGTPWDSIVRNAREVDADLIVLGSHGYSGIDRVLGTTAAKVVNHTDRNVLVVRTAL